MMYGYGNGMSGWGYALMIAVLLMVVGLVATGVLVFIRRGAAARRPATLSSCDVMPVALPGRAGDHTDAVCTRSVHQTLRQ